MIVGLDKSKQNPIVSEEGQRELLSSNKDSVRCPSSDIINSSQGVDHALRCLAEILVDAYVCSKKIYED